MALEEYEVIGPHPFLGHEHGERFRADLPEGQRRRAIARNAIRPVKGAKKPKGKSEEKSEAKSETKPSREELEHRARGLGIENPEKDQERPVGDEQED